LADQLADEHRRLDTLSIGDRAVRSSIGLSYRALAPRPRQLFRLLGAFTEADVPAWVAAAALEVAEPEAEDLIEDLVDARLMAACGSQRQPRGRYDMHALVRLYARERYLADEPEADRKPAALRVIGGWLDLAERAQARLPGGLPRIGTGNGQRWPAPVGVTADALANPMDWFETERLALVSAVETACTLGLDELAWDLTGCLGRFLELRGHFDLWRSVLERALAAVRPAGNRRGEAHLLRGLAEVWIDVDEYNKGLDCLNRSLKIFKELREPLAEAHVHRAIGALERMRGNNAAAARRLELALGAFRENDDPIGLADTLFSLGALRRDQGRDDEALAYYEQALRIEDQLGNRFNQGLLMCSIGSSLIAQGRLNEARAALARGLTVAGENENVAAFAMAFLGEADALAGDTETAASHLAAALEIFQRARDRYGEAVTLRILGELHRIRCEFDQASKMLDRALELWDQIDAPHWRARTLVSLGLLELSQGNRAAARAAWQSAEDLFTRLQTTERKQVSRLLRGIDMV
jgi:tetratricopeptide (TPR) repeat protein